MSKKENIIITAAMLIHEKGYNNIGIKAILEELDIPKGSFYYYFKSKEDLGLSIIDLYIQDTRNGIEVSENSVEGILAFFNMFFDRLMEMEMKKGCPIGNLVMELSDAKESFRLKLMEWYVIIENWIVSVLEREKIILPIEKAKILVSSFEGSMMLSKLDKDNVHFKLFNEYTFHSIINI